MSIKQHYAILWCLVAAVVLFATNKSLTVALQFDRAAIVNSWQFWRLATCHFTHWNASHCFWDVIAFIMAGYGLIRFSPKFLWSILLISSLSIALCIMVFNPEVLLYRGLSGVDMGMFVLLALLLINRFARKKQWYGMVTAIILLLALTVKLTYEGFSGDMLFVAGDGKGTLIVTAHVAGMISGVIVFLLLKNDNSEKIRLKGKAINSDDEAG